MAKWLEKKSVGRPNKSNKDHENATSSEKGTAAGYRRRSYLTNIELSQKIDGIAYWDSKTIKQVLFEAMSLYVSNWEKDKGPVKLPGQQEQ